MKVRGGNHLQFRILADTKFSRHRALIESARKMSEDNTKRDNPVVVDDKTGEVLGRWVKLARVHNKSAGPRPFKYLPDTTNLVRSSTGEIVNMNEAAQLAKFEQLAMGDDQDRLEAGRRLAKLAEKKGYPELEILLVEPSSEDYNVEGTHIAQVSHTYDDRGNLAMGFKMTKEGSRRMAMLTTRNKPFNGMKKQMGIVIQEKLHTAPTINSVITGNGIIEGQFSQEEIDELMAVFAGHE